MVLSKFPIVDYQVVLLPRHMDDKRCVEKYVSHYVHAIQVLLAQH